MLGLLISEGKLANESAVMLRLKLAQWWGYELEKKLAQYVVVFFATNTAAEVNCKCLVDFCRMKEVFWHFEARKARSLLNHSRTTARAACDL